MVAASSIKVSNVSMRATQKDLADFFGFAGEIQSMKVEKGEGEDATQIAYITFDDEQALDVAILLDGAVMVDRAVEVVIAHGYVPPPPAPSPQASPAEAASGAAVPPVGASFAPVARAQDMVSTLLAKGYVLSKDAMGKAQAFDDKHQLSKKTFDRATSISQSATTTVSNFDRRVGLSDKISAGAASVSQSIRDVDSKYAVSAKSREAFAFAEQKVNEAAAAVIKNPYVASGATWLTNSFSRLGRVATDVRDKTKEKVNQQEQEKLAHGEAAAATTGVATGFPASAAIAVPTGVATGSAAGTGVGESEKAAEAVEKPAAVSDAIPKESPMPAV
eukprot:TRINITY_DN11584_c0_g1_i1.p1 TRINITY_DN11584_c0_g1~~TRINITY_DN11584_c0_g1_i1.p1  ORF type:complete len:333 (+),score=72.57 TRINITY_DN11584_c0_g1_i1:255-1253(+)